MSWGAPTAAVMLLQNGEAAGSLVATSTSTMLSTTFADAHLRMYFTTDGGNVQGYDPAPADVTDLPEYWKHEVSVDDLDCATHDYDDQWTQNFIPYIDSARFTLPTSALGFSIEAEFSGDTYDAAQDDAQDLLNATCIPGFKLGEGWPYEFRTYARGPSFGGMGKCFWSGALHTGSFLVTYKDPCVVPVPSSNGQDGNGYLMMTVRVRVLRADAAKNIGLVDADELRREQAVMAVNGNPQTGAPDLRRPGGCYADIVAWWAPDASFTTGLKGPFLLVDSLDALDFRHRRAWLGVPGGAFLRTGGEDWLYLYYVMERHDGEGALTSALSEPDCPDAVTYAKSTSFGPGGLEVEYTDPVSPFERGIGVRRFKLSDIVNEIVDVPEDLVVPEACWSPATDPGVCLPWTGPVTGENLGRVNIWVARKDSSAGVTAFEDHFRRIVAAGPEIRYHFPYPADPAPVVCDGVLSLFFAAIGIGGDVRVTPTSGHGIWRAAGLPDGEAVEVFSAAGVRTGPHECVLGRDFVVSARKDARGLLSPDQLIVSDASIQYLDPDPVQLPDGSWRVFFGSDTGGPLQRIDGDREDGCRSWEEAWGIPTPFDPSDDLWSGLGVPGAAKAPPTGFAAIDWSKAALGNDAALAWGGRSRSAPVAQEAAREFATFSWADAALTDTTLCAEAAPSQRLGSAKRRSGCGCG